MSEVAVGEPTVKGNDDGGNSGGRHRRIRQAARSRRLLGPLVRTLPTACNHSEKVVRSAEGKVKLFKMNIDEHPQIAGQLGIRSIPAVIAFQNGQPVDGFMGALPESQVKTFIERLVGPTADPFTDMLQEAEAAHAAGDLDDALAIYSELLSLSPTAEGAGRRCVYSRRAGRSQGGARDFEFGGRGGVG